MNRSWICISAFGLAFVVPASFAEYETSSGFSANYRCVAHETGGYHHGDNDHVLTTFKENDEFFLTHISRIPLPALKKMKAAEIVNSLNGDMERLREIVEDSYMSREIVHGEMFVETGSYFIRTSDRDPHAFSSYLHECEAYGGTEFPQIICDYNYGSEKFDFDVSSGRFAYSTLGTWHTNRRDGYQGDSSVFAFGTCKEYYN